MNYEIINFLFIAHIALVVGIGYNIVINIILGQGGSGFSILLMIFHCYILFYHNPVFKGFLEDVKDKWGDKK